MFILCFVVGTDHVRNESGALILHICPKLCVMVGLLVRCYAPIYREITHVFHGAHILPFTPIIESTRTTTEEGSKRLKCLDENMCSMKYITSSPVQHKIHVFTSDQVALPAVVVGTVCRKTPCVL